MGSRKKHKGAGGQVPAEGGPVDAKAGFPRGFVVSIGLLIIAGGALWWEHSGRAPTPGPDTAPTAGATSPRAPAPVPASALEKLRGRWQRSDGGYVLEIRTKGDGIEAGYFNPRPIHVAKAEATQDGPTTRLVVEMRDVNYPGSTYTLYYDPGADALRGVYFQAVEGVSFDVDFVRMK